MKVLVINNGKDVTAYTFVEGSKWEGYSGLFGFLEGQYRRRNQRPVQALRARTDRIAASSDWIG